MKLTDDEQLWSYKRQNPDYTGHAIVTSFHLLQLLQHGLTYIGVQYVKTGPSLHLGGVMKSTMNLKPISACGSQPRLLELPRAKGESCH